MRTSKLRYKWNFLNGLMFQPTVAWDVFKMDMRYLSLKRLQVRSSLMYPVPDENCCAPPTSLPSSCVILVRSFYLALMRGACDADADSGSVMTPSSRLHVCWRTG